MSKTVDLTLTLKQAELLAELLKYFYRNDTSMPDEEVDALENYINLRIAWLKQADNRG